MLIVCALKCQKLQTPLRSVYSLEMFITDLVFSLRDLGLIVSFNSEIVTERLHSNNVFKLLETYIFFRDT